MKRYRCYSECMQWIRSNHVMYVHFFFYHNNTNCTDFLRIVLFLLFSVLSSKICDTRNNRPKIIGHKRLHSYFEANLGANKADIRCSIRRYNTQIILHDFYSIFCWERNIFVVIAAFFSNFLCFWEVINTKKKRISGSPSFWPNCWVKVVLRKRYAMLSDMNVSS